MIPAPFDYLVPQSLDEAVAALAAHGEEAKLLAGGHSLLPLMKLRLACPKLLIDLGRIPGLSGIREEDGKLVIGALTTHYEIESSELLREKCALLSAAAGEIGDLQVRHRGTIGGSLAHGDPAADLPAAVLALGGELRVWGAEGERSLPAGDFFLGLMSTALRPTEILTEIRVPLLSGKCGAAYLKVRQKASGFAIVGVAVWLRMSGDRLVEDIGIGVTGLGTKPFRAAGIEERLKGKKLEPSLLKEAASRVSQDADPLEDLHASAEFRVHLARLYTIKAIEQAVKKVGGQ